MGTKQLTADKLTEVGLTGMETTEIEMTQPKPDEETLPDAADSDWVIRRPKRAKITAEESLKRMQSFHERKEQFIASIRKGKS